MFSRMPVAPSTDSSSSGEEIAALAASALRLSPAAGADAHQRRAGVLHDRAHVGEVEVDQAGDRDQVGDALDALAQHVVGLAEGVEHRGAPLDDREQLLVGDHDQRVDDLAQAQRHEFGQADNVGIHVFLLPMHRDSEWHLTLLGSSTIRSVLDSTHFTNGP